MRIESFMSGGFKAVIRESDTSKSTLSFDSSEPPASVDSDRRAQARGINEVPTHAVGRARERRAYTRARLALSLRVQRIAGQRAARPASLRTVDISSSGVFFLYPQRIEPGTPIELDVLLVDRALGRGTVHMHTAAHVVRTETAQKRGWHGLAATFDDISFLRDDAIPSR